MSILTLIIGIVVGWFIANLWTMHQLSELSPNEVSRLKRRLDQLIEDEAL